MKQKLFTLLTLLLCVCSSAWGASGDVLFSQNFNSATAVAYTSGTATSITSSSSNNIVGTTATSQFSFIGITNKNNAGFAINSSTGGNSIDATGFFQAYCNATGQKWSIVHNTNFAATAPTAIKVEMDILFKQLSSGSDYSVSFAVGDGFSNETSSPATTNVHSGFSIINNSTPKLSQYLSTTSIYNTGINHDTWISIVWIINNTGSSLTYDNPTGSGTTTLNNDCFDIWIKTQAGAASTYTKIVANQAATTAAKTLQNLYIGDPAGKKNEFRLDNVVVTDLTPSSKTDVTLTLGSTSGSKDIADGRTFNFSTLATVTADPDVTAITNNLKYSSSDEAVAEINQNTGAITLKKAGTAKLTVSFDGDEDYNEASVDYDLTVTSSTDFTADLRSKSSGSYGIAADGSEVAVDDPSAVVTLTMSGYNGAQHGWNPGTVITVPVTGPAKLVLGTCNYGNGAVTVTNSSDETVLSFNTKDGTCYHNNTTNNVVTRYYDGDATTLTITVNNYLPYVAVSAVGLDEVKYPVTFDVSGASITAGSAPAEALVTRGGDFVIPANNSVYKSGKTLTGWTNSATSASYNIGESIENVTGDITLTPNFENNAFELDELTAATTVSFYLNQGNGAPVMAASNGSTMRMAQATVSTESIDVLMNVTSTTKFNNNQGAESAQIVATSENPTTIQVPGVAGMTVTMNANFATSYLGESTNTGTWADSKTTWTYDGASDPVTLTIIADGYPSLMTVTYPAKPTCETPTITPATFTADNQEVTITSATVGATIYYTTDGTDPTTSSDVYDSESKPTISNTTTFKAYAVKDGAFDSEVATVKITRTASATWGSWDFTNWSSATQTGVLGDGTNWDQYEKASSKGANFGDSKGRANKVTHSGVELSYGSGSSTTIPETAGLNFTTTSTNSMALMFDYPSTDIGTYAGGQYIWLYSSNAKIIIPSVPAGSVVSVDIESHKIAESRTITVKLGDTTLSEKSSKTGATTKTTMQYDVTSTGNVTISPAGSGLHIYKITVTANVETVPITIASGKEYTTLTSASNLNFTDVAGLKPYVVTAGISENKVTLSQRNKMAAGNGMVLKAETTGKTYNVPVFVGAGDDVTGNKMVGSATTTTAIAANGGYILKSGVFQPASAGSLPAGKAYLNIAVTSAHPLTITFDDENGEATSIKGVEAQKFMENNKFYNLNGQEVQNPTKGMYIVNGKKVIVK